MQKTSITGPDWIKLNENFLERREAVNRFYEGLEEKIRKAMNSDETWSKLLDKCARFQGSANAYFNEWLQTLATLSNDEELLKLGGTSNQKQEIFNSLKIDFEEWNNASGFSQNAGSEFRNEATITIESLLEFKPHGFYIIVCFLVETNPTTWAQEFRLKAFGGVRDQLTWEREKGTLLLHSLRSDGDWANIGYPDGDITNNAPRIEAEIYSVINYFIYGGGTRTYRNVDFQPSK